MASLELRCSVQSRILDSDPTGSAGDHDAFVLVEVPLPWPREITEHPLLLETMAAVEASGLRVRVLGMVPDELDRTRPVAHRVVIHRRPPGPFRRYVRSERVVGPDELATAVGAMLGAAFDADDDDDGRDQDPTVDLLICTHGRRDRCCGSDGMNLFTALGERPVRAGVRTWRVSHTGGHRFAPTAILLPDGHMWAWLDGDLVDAIVHRSRPPAELIGHYRGSTAIGEPAAQLAERAAFAHEGWSWLDVARTATVERDGDRRRVRLDGVRPNGAGVTYDAVVTQIGTTAQPVCGEPAGTGTKADPVWEVTTFAVGPALDPEPPRPSR